jgi:hypothetical protein
MKVSRTCCVVPWTSFKRRSVEAVACLCRLSYAVCKRATEVRKAITVRTQCVHRAYTHRPVYVRGAVSQLALTRLPGVAVDTSLLLMFGRTVGVIRGYVRIGFHRIHLSR